MWLRHRVVLLSGSYKVYPYFSWSRSLARTSDEGAIFESGQNLMQVLLLPLRHCRGVYLSTKIL